MASDKLSDKRAILVVLGSLIKSPILFDSCSLEQADFNIEPFYEIIFSAIYNLWTTGVNVIDCFAIDSFLSNYPTQYKIFSNNNGLEYIVQATELAETENFEYYYNRLKKIGLLRFWESEGVDTSSIYNPDVIEPKAQEEESRRFDELTINDLIEWNQGRIIDEAKMRFGSNTVSKGQQAGKGMLELIEKLKQVPEVGMPLQSPIINTIARGARLKKLYLRSASSGSGKTRTAMADLCNISVPWLYDIEQKKWVHTGFSEPSLFISTELEFDECQTMMIAYISGVGEDHILNGNYIDDEEERVIQASEYITEAPLYIEFIPDFSIQDIENIIKRYKREKGCLYFVFDYIHMSAKLIAEVSAMSKGMRMREDQVLFLFADKLKNMCNTLGIFILTMTQLNGTYKDSPVKDETMLRGAKNLADRIDFCEITLHPTKGELDSIKTILAHQINKPIPNLVRHIYKVRRGKLTRVRVYQYADLGTCRTQDLFITDNDGKLISMEINKIKSMDEVIEQHSIKSEELQVSEEEQQESVKALFNW